MLYRNGFVDDVNGWNFHNGNNQVFSGQEDNHGTHGAGTIAGAWDGQEVTGIADSNYVKIMVLKALGSQSIIDLPVQELTDIVNAFCQVVEQNGYVPIIYSDYYKFTTEMDTVQFPYDLWMARYGTDHTFPNRTIWQATDQGTVDGIAGNVCIEFAFKDYGSAGGEWRQEGEAWYYYRDGSRVTGWIQDHGVWYYLQPERGGAMTAGESVYIDGVEYGFEDSGA